MRADGTTQQLQLQATFAGGEGRRGIKAFGYVRRPPAVKRHDDVTGVRRDRHARGKLRSRRSRTHVGRDPGRGRRRGGEPEATSDAHDRTYAAER